MINFTTGTGGKKICNLEPMDPRVLSVPPHRSARTTAPSITRKLYTTSISRKRITSGRNYPIKQGNSSGITNAPEPMPASKRAIKHPRDHWNMQSRRSSFYAVKSLK